MVWCRKVADSIFDGVFHINIFVVFFLIKGGITKDVIVFIYFSRLISWENAVHFLNTFTVLSSRLCLWRKNQHGYNSVM